MDNLWKTPVTLQGKFVRLEPLSEAHVPALAAVGCDDRIWKLMLYGLIRTEADMHTWVRRLLAGQAAGTDLPFAVIQLRVGPGGRRDPLHGSSPGAPRPGDRRHLVRAGLPAYGCQHREQVSAAATCFRSAWNYSGPAQGGLAQ